MVISKRLILLLFFMVWFPAVAWGIPDRTGRWDAGLDVEGFLADDSDIDDSFYVGGNVSYGLSDRFALGLETGWSEVSVNLSRTAGQATEDAGDVTFVPLLADLYYRAPPYQEQVIFYGVLGMGLMIMDTDPAAAFTGSGGDVDADTGFALKIGGGLDSFLDPEKTWMGNLSFSYVAVDEKVESKTTSGATVDDADLDYWMVGGGLKYLFD